MFAGLGLGLVLEVELVFGVVVTERGAVVDLNVDVDADAIDLLV